jgi:serine/threonine-protein kinase
MPASTTPAPFAPSIASASAEPAFEPGKLLGGRYRLVALLGRGAMGEVFRAWDERLQQEVALKRLPPRVADDAQALERFHSEVRLGRQVSHPNVCRLHDLVEIDGRPMLSMQFIDGEDLASRIARDGALAPAAVERLARELCAGLAEAHAQGVIHRDLKPANVLLDAQGKGHIADFGVAALAGGDPSALAGTPAYLAPELLENRPASAQSDLYALGLVLYEALTGRRRFSPRSLDDLRQRHAEEPPLTEHRALPGASPALRRLIVACLQRDPAARPSSAAAALQLVGPAPAYSPAARRMLVLAGIVVLLLAGGLAWFGTRPPELPPARLGPSSTAVLPFANLSGEEGDAALASGLAVTLVDRLSEVKGLAVAGGSSSLRFSSDDADLRAIGVKLGVATVVRGTVQRAGSTLRVTAQLVRAADGKTLWSQRFERDAGAGFAVGDDIASGVLDALSVTLLRDTQAGWARHGTNNAQALAKYGEGRRLLRQMNYAVLDQADAALGEALRADPDYVDALLARVEVTWTRAVAGTLSGSEMRAQAQPLLDRVEAIDPGNARLLMLRAWLTDDQEIARRLFDRAYAMAPGDADIRAARAGFIGESEGWEIGLRELDRALALDPLNLDALVSRAGALVRLGRLDEADRALDKVLELEPDNVAVPFFRMYVAVYRDDVLQQALVLRRMFALERSSETAASLAVVLQAIGFPDAADAWLREAGQAGGPPLFADAARVRVLMLRGEATAAVARALELVDRGEEENSQGTWSIAIDYGCLAAAQLGTAAEMRTRLREAGELPAAYTPDALAVLEERAGLAPPLRLVLLNRCLYTGSAEDAGVRREIADLLTQVKGAGWTREWTRYASELVGPRDALVTGFIDPRSQLAAAGEPATARLLGISEEPRVRAFLAERARRRAHAHEMLPTELAKAKLSLLPPVSPAAVDDAAKD